MTSGTRILYLCGAGNPEGTRLARRVNDNRTRWGRIVLLDDDPARQGLHQLDVEVIGPFSLLATADPTRDEAVNLVARTTAGRGAARRKIEAHGIPLASLVAPDVDPWGVELADDVTVYPRVTLGPESAIGTGSVVFMGAVVGHESRVGTGCVIASNAVLNARVRLGDGVYVGTNATVIPEIKVGDGATIGAGSVVVEDVPAEATVMGVPARVLKGAFSDPDAERPESRSVPQVEALLSEAWGRALGMDTLGPELNVFDLGATSRMALQVGEGLRRDWGLALDLVDLFRFPRLRDLARHLGSESGDGSGQAGVKRGMARSPNSTWPLSGSHARDEPSNAIPAPGSVAPDASAAGGSATDDLVGTVSRVFEAILGLERVDPESHFFHLGGDTAEAQRACRELQRVTGRPICYVEIARHPTPRDLADHMGRTAEGPPTCPVRWVADRMINRHAER